MAHYLTGEIKCTHITIHITTLILIGITETIMDIIHTWIIADQCAIIPAIVFQGAHIAGTNLKKVLTIFVNPYRLLTNKRYVL